MENDNLYVPNDDVYVVLATCIDGIQLKFKTTGDIVGSLLNKYKRPNFLRPIFKMRTTEQNALLVDLKRVVTMEITKFVDNSDDTPPYNS